MNLRIKSIIWNIRKKKYLIRTATRNKNPKKYADGLRNVWDNFKCSNIQIIGVPEGEEEEQEIENLLEKIMKENFPNLVKEIDFQEVQEAQQVPRN